MMEKHYKIVLVPYLGQSALASFGWDVNCLFASSKAFFCGAFHDHGLVF